MNVWVFVISMFVPTFGGELDISFSTKDRVSCGKLERLVVRELYDMQFKFDLRRPCHEVKP